MHLFVKDPQVEYPWTDQNENLFYGFWLFFLQIQGDRKMKIKNVIHEFYKFISIFIV